MNEIPFKISFFMWKLLKKNLPLDASLSRFNIHKGLSCFCCRVACQETTDHAFAGSEMAKHTWDIISRPLGRFHMTWYTINAIIWQWWRHQPKNIIHKFLLRIAPMIVCWKIWKARRTKKYEHKNISASNICFQSLFQIKVAMEKKFKFIDYNWN